MVASEGKSDGCAPPWRPFTLEGCEGPLGAKSNLRLLVRAIPGQA